jgi:hypothetical protein
MCVDGWEKHIFNPCWIQAVTTKCGISLGVWILSEGTESQYDKENVHNQAFRCLHTNQTLKSTSTHGKVNDGVHLKIAAFWRGCLLHARWDPVPDSCSESLMQCFIRSNTSQGIQWSYLHMVLMMGQLHTLPGLLRPRAMSLLEDIRHDINNPFPYCRLSHNFLTEKQPETEAWETHCCLVKVMSNLLLIGQNRLD